MIDPVGLVETFEMMLLGLILVLALCVEFVVLSLTVRDAWRHWWRAPWDRAVRFVRGVFLRGGLWR